MAMVFFEKQYSEVHIDDDTNERFIPLADTTIGQWIPCEWSEAADPNTPSITLEELRLHTSGLPPQAPNHDAAPMFDGNPFGGYTQQMLCSSLLKLTALPSRGRFLYSNYAYGLLGYALQFVSQHVHIEKGYKTAPLPSYQEVVQESVLNPFKMNHTSVELSEEGWENAAKGCARGLNKAQYAMRRGEYGVLQGNGALRSTLTDMASFLVVTLLVEGGFIEQNQDKLTPQQQSCYQAIKALNEHSEDACTCVSGWCEGNLCTLPNPVQEQITDSGTTIYTSGGLPGKRKSGDTEGYSVRGAWSLSKGRAVFVVDTCGGCGERGTSGSAAQRVALLLADGLPDSRMDDKQATESCDVDESLILKQVPELLVFAGKAESHVFPSVTYVEVQVKTIYGKSTISVASSDGAGCSAPARPIVAKDKGDNDKFVGWEYDTSVLYGCGFGGNDPLAIIPQKRSLRLVSNEFKGRHGQLNEMERIRRIVESDSGAVLQEMGQDIYLALKKMELKLTMTK